MNAGEKILLAFLLASLFTASAAAQASEPYFIDEQHDLFLRGNLGQGTQQFDVYAEPGYAPNGSAVMWAYDDFSSARLDRRLWSYYRQGDASLRMRDGDLVLRGNGNNSSAMLVLNRQFDRGVEIVLNESFTNGTKDAGAYADVSFGSGEIRGDGRSGAEWWHPAFEQGGLFRSQGLAKPLIWKDGENDWVPSMGISMGDYANRTAPHTVCYGYDQQGRAYADVLGIEQLRTPISAPDPYGYGQFIHPDVAYDAQGILGHKFWLFVTPFAWSDERLENACLYFSDDGLDYRTPSGIINPIGAPTAECAKSAYGSDPELVYDAKDKKLMLYYVIGNIVGNQTQEIPKVRTYDGRNLSAPRDLIFEGAEGALFVSPSILYDQETDRFYLWVVDISQERTNTICRFDSEDGIRFSHKKVVRQSYWKKIWHLDVLTRPTDGKLYAVMTFVGDDNLFLGTARSLEEGFAVNYRRPVLRSEDASAGIHANTQVYRSSGAFSDDGQVLRLWVSGKDASGMRSVFFSQAVFGSEGWKAQAPSAQRMTVMRSVNASAHLPLPKRWMISQGKYQDQGGERILHEMWAYRTGYDAKITVSDLGNHKRIRVTSLGGTDPSEYQIKVPGKLLGITSRQASLRLSKV